MNDHMRIVLENNFGDTVKTILCTEAYWVRYWVATRRVMKVGDTLTCYDSNGTFANYYCKN